MRRWIRAAPATVCVLALAAALAGCNESGSGNGGKNPASATSAGGTTFRLGEAGPVQESVSQASQGSKYTVTPESVKTGTTADLDNSGLEQDKGSTPQVPVYVWVTVAVKSGKAVRVGEMSEDLLVRTSAGTEEKPLTVLLGEAKWPDCPPTDTDRRLSPGQSEKICTAFLLSYGQTPTAVELSQGFSDDPLQWPVRN